MTEDEFAALPRKSASDNANSGITDKFPILPNISLDCTSRPVLNIMLGLVNILAENITDLLVARVIEPDLPDISAKRA